MGLRNLDKLTLRINRINSLDEELFNETIKLRELDLADNILKVIPKRLFVGMGKLKVLSPEKIQVNLIYEKIFNVTKQLTFLWLSRNNLVQVRNDLFKGLRIYKHFICLITR